MTSTLKRTFAIAGTVVAFATLSFAADQGVKANIQFPFYVRGVAMPAATYEISSTSTQSGAPLFKISNEDSSKALLMPFMQRAQSGHSDSLQPRLVFHCAAEACWISEMWTGSDVYYRANTPKIRLASNEKIRVAVVYLDTRKGN